MQFSGIIKKMKEHCPLVVWLRLGLLFLVRLKGFTDGARCKDDKQTKNQKSNLQVELAIAWIEVVQHSATEELIVDLVFLEVQIIDHGDHEYWWQDLKSYQSDEQQSISFSSCDDIAVLVLL